MGLTLIAILTAALLLPGIIAARSFYHASKTGEVEPSIPALSSMDGIALVGLFSVIVHFVYATGLVIAMSVPSITTMPAANPISCSRLTRDICPVCTPPLLYSSD